MNKSISRDGEGLTVNLCQCCNHQQPDGTLILVGYRAYCRECLMTCQSYAPFICLAKAKAQAMLPKGAK